MIYAYDNSKNKIHILNAEGGVCYSCRYCNTDVMTKQGSMMPWHFYHLKGEYAEDCLFPSNIGCILNIKNHDAQCKAGHICKQDCQFSQ